jgi:threonine dehydrogenase-like Zn-dependent dehydrogenase
VTGTLKEMTGDLGRDACIEAVGMVSHGYGIDYKVDRVKQTMKLGRDSAHSLRQAIYVCRKGETSLRAGIFFLTDNFPLGAVVNKGAHHQVIPGVRAQVHSAPAHHAAKGEFDPSFMMTHKFSLEDAAKGYETWRMKQDGCLRMMFTPGTTPPALPGPALA